MFLKNKISLILLAGCFFVLPAISMAIGDCDSTKHCLGNALTLEVTSGKGAHYVDIEKTESQYTINTAMTIEMWVKAERQAGKVQFLAGLWGPGEDVNDVWVLYINTADELVFEVNGANTNLKSADNTRAGVSFSSYYDAWHHVAAVFDGAASSVTIYIDGKLEATETNTEYPVSRLRDLANDELPIQIGRTNALTNNPDLNRTFKGQLDEIRIWNKTFSESEIFCQKDMSLEGNEDGMLLYYRCNEEPWNFDLCDATDNGNTGLARSGAKCTSSDRTYTKTVNVTPMNVSLPIKDTIKCVNSKTYRFSVVNTSPCAKNVRIRIRDVHKDKFTISPNNTLLLEQNIPQEFEITIDADFTGAITDRLDVYSFNRCRDWNTWSVNITRITELHYSTDGVDFGILKADCIENPWVDTVVTICNNSEEIQPPGPVTVNSLYTNDPNVFRVIPSETLPHTLQPGECMEATVRFIAGSESDIFEDTLYVESDDRCEQMYKIPLKGEVIEALAIQTRNGSDRIDTIKFETTCVNFISQAEEYLWENLTQENIFIDTIITPGHFISKSFKFPVLLEPETGYLPNYFRFLPESSGDFLDSAIFVVKTEDCTIHRKVYFKARGFFSDVDFLDTLVDFGDVMVGQESVRQVEVINKSPDPLKLSVYLKKGDAYFLRGAKILNLGPGQTGSVDLTFKPSEPLEYFDEICIFDQRCYESRCIPVRGRGYTETFLYEPYVMETGNVIGCQSSRDTLIITNNTGQPLTLSNFVLDDPSGKFSHVRTVVSGADFTLNDAFDLGAGDRALLIFDYIPDDVTLDRADRAYIRYETQDGEKFAGELLGTSLRPKIFVTANVDFGTVEAGDTRMDTMTVENVSVASIRLDSVTADEGFEILWPRDLPKQLAPGDSVMVIVRFAPTESKTYDGKLKAYSSEPCNVEESGDLLGEGEIIPLEMPLSVVSFGKIRPCDCEEREIQLINRSLVFDMNIDSIWIDDENITDAATEFFTWESYEYNSQGSVFPFSLSPMSTSILKVIYCPRVPSERDLLDHSARIHVKARGSGWSNEYNSYLSGIQALLTEPDRFNVYFPPTRVDTFAAPQYVEYSIPGLDVNPQRSKIRVDSITFIPDERVFTASDSDGRPFYIEYDSSETFNIEVDFKPRAVRYYKAKMALHISEPCVYVDSTVSVEGSGFAPAFELSFNFDRQRSRLDTFRVINCDTLRIPVYSNPDIPAEFVDITMRLKYDTTKLDYAGAESIYLQDYCDPYLPYIDADDSDSLGTLFTLKNFCEVDSVRPFLLAKFVPKVERDTFKIFIDSLFFDTEEVILYQLITQRDSALIIIQKPEFEVLNTMNFDSVRVLDCAEDTLYVKNTGDVPIKVNDFGEFLDGVEYLFSEPTGDSEILPGDTAMAIIRYCPRRSESLLHTTAVYSDDPCFLEDQFTYEGIGYAPAFPVGFDLAGTFTIPDDLYGQLSGMITVPVINEKDFADSIQGEKIWLEALNFDIDFEYNPYALKFIEARNFTSGELNTTYDPGMIRLSFKDTDSLEAGTIAEMDFTIVIPDTVRTSITLHTGEFSTDSILFLDIQPYGDSGFFNSEGKCNLTYFKFTGESSQLRGNSPNPWSESTKIEFSLGEKVRPVLSIYSRDGRLIDMPLDGTTELEPGRYNVELSGRDYQSGVYYYVLEAGLYRDKGIMSVIR